jgi:distribution and morphology protein 31
VQTDDVTDMAVIMELKLKNIRAAVPLQTEELSYVTNAAIRPIIAYLNANAGVISVPLHFTVPLVILISYILCLTLTTILQRLFEGAHTIYCTGLVDLLAQHATQAMGQLAIREYAQTKRLQRIGWWSLGAVARQVVGLWGRSPGHPRVGSIGLNSFGVPYTHVGYC